MDDPEFSCPHENVDHGELGRVLSAEKLGCLYYHKVRKRHLRNDQTLRPEFFTQRKMNEGISLIRLDKMTLPDLTPLAEAITATGDDASLWGIFVADTARLRAIIDELCCRSLCVVDDPVKDDPRGAPDNPAHAIAIVAHLSPARFAVDKNDPEVLRIQREVAHAFGRLVENLGDAYAATS